MSAWDGTAERAASGGIAVRAGEAPEPVYTVAHANALARELLEGALPQLWIAGEVTGWKRYPSGHCYFSLRDARAQLSSVLFRSDARRLPADPENGMRVRALGRLTIYERRGDYQFVVRRLEAEDAGGLWRIAFERLRLKLEAAGLLAPERKRELPRHPRTVGIVTSPAGAALHDILHVIERRAPWTRVLFSPASVQGDGAAHEIARAIRRLSRSNADLLIVGRGGGSIEDLWSFNEEIVARAIAASPIPVISGVGHETDVTIADLVADFRAPTPSAAAERAVPDGAALEREVLALVSRLDGATRQRLARPSARLDVLADLLRGGVRETVRRPGERLRHAATKLEALSPLAAMRRGYAVPLTHAGKLLRRTAEFAAGDRFDLRVVDGHVDCRVEGVHASDAASQTTADAPAGARLDEHPAARPGLHE